MSQRVSTGARLRMRPARPRPALGSPISRRDSPLRSRRVPVRGAGD